MNRKTENYFVVYLLPVGCGLFSGVKLSMKSLLLPVYCSRLIFWAAIRFENKCRDRTIGWLIFIDFRIVTLSVSFCRL